VNEVVLIVLTNVTDQKWIKSNLQLCWQSKLMLSYFHMWERSVPSHTIPGRTLWKKIIWIINIQVDSLQLNYTYFIYDNFTLVSSIYGKADVFRQMQSSFKQVPSSVLMLCLLARLERNGLRTINRITNVIFAILLRYEVYCWVWLFRNQLLRPSTPTQSQKPCGFWP
jgi:hypothetical protein